MVKISLLCFAMLFSHFCNSQLQSLKEKLLNDSLFIITKRVEASIIKGRYMEKKLIAQTDTLENWKGITVGLYEYRETATAPLARVYLADAEAKKLAAWIITACVEATGKLDYNNTSLLIFKINEASNGQFPVLGAVVENDIPYFFKDGVTIRLKEKITNYLDPHLIEEGNVESTRLYGRIISTTREQYNALFPGADTAGHKWRDIVRTEYQKALPSNSNNLITAWAKANLK